MHTVSIALAIENQTLRSAIEVALQDVTTLIVLNQSDLSDLGTLLMNVDRARPEALLIDLTSLRNWEDSLRAIKNLPSPPQIIGVHTSPDGNTILEAIRAGANEYLFPPLKETLHKALNRVSADRKSDEAARPQGKIIGVLSVKGGCGATTIACHLAVDFPRAPEQHVLLADFDMDAGIIRFLMKAKSQYSLLDATNNTHRLDTSFWRALISNGRPGLEVIAAPPSLAAKESPRPDQIQHVLRFVRTQYDWTIIDMGRGINHLSAGALELTDDLYLVSTIDVPALHQTSQIVQTLVDIGYDREHIHLVLNRVPKRLDVTPEELEKILGLKVYEMLPDDHAALYECYAEGKLLSGASKLGKQLTDLSARIAGIQPEPGKRKFSLFG